MFPVVRLSGAVMLHVLQEEEEEQEQEGEEEQE
jgi:hypothetical protein